MHPFWLCSTPRYLWFRRMPLHADLEPAYSNSMATNSRLLCLPQDLSRMLKDVILPERRLWHVSRNVKSEMGVSGVAASPSAQIMIMKPSLHCYLHKQLVFASSQYTQECSSLELQFGQPCRKCFVNVPHS